MKSQSLWHAFVMSLVSILPVSAADIEDTATQQVKTACSAAQYLHKLASKLEQARPSAKEIRTTAIKTAMAYRIKAAFSQDKQTEIAFLAMAAVTEAGIDTLNRETEAAAKRYNDAVRIIKQQEAAMLTLHRTESTSAKVTSTAPSTAAQLESVTGMVKCPSTAAFKLEAATCTLDTEKEAVKTNDIAHESHTKIKIIDVTKPATTYTVTTHCKGKLSSSSIASTMQDGGCIERGSDFNTAANNAMATALTKKATTYSTIDINLFTNVETKTCTQINPTAPYTEYDKDTLGNALCNIRQLKKPTYTPIHRISWAAVRADDKLLQALTDLIAPGGKAPTEQQAKKALTDAYLGSDQTAFTARITDSIDKTPLNLKVRETTFDKTIFETAGTDSAATVLTFLQGKQLIASRTAATASSSPEVRKEISKKCAAITNKEKCKTEDGCEFKDGNCVAAEKNKGEEKKEEKCKGKGEKDCGEAAGYKWEGETCKDFSFLLNNTSPSWFLLHLWLCFSKRIFPFPLKRILLSDIF
ncbi:variant surface glycoprotein (VSG), putative [Trypanosoma brucei brucei TREU927]|uniref:Variant surface glycoprotein (VSG), putative n=1 Tax=Trypanosoma brucei brucei (strain 927/4 GUTat10.1) TaxID=185431 RepID=Q4FK95_TRYB2|nr:variant surface glycoprotein [Trypanosoma brucei brucei TREU927]EAN78987.1 variant surface glycoprotein (VSG), putative [Trypanosoma brucei brucei TREU927]CAJ17151.1 variant surface glycoprotein (VSG), putative [Trypanosoma brucei brucei TREU927]